MPDISGKCLKVPGKQVLRLAPVRFIQIVFELLCNSFSAPILLCLCSPPFNWVIHTYIRAMAAWTVQRACVVRSQLHSSYHIASDIGIAEWKHFIKQTECDVVTTIVCYYKCSAKDLALLSCIYNAAETKKTWKSVFFCFHLLDKQMIRYFVSALFHFVYFIFAL